MVPTLGDVRGNPRFRFKSGNAVGYYQDFGFGKGLPADRDFYFRDYVKGDQVELVAKGYGVRNDYGNGSIIVSLKNVDVDAALWKQARELQLKELNRRLDEAEADVRDLRTKIDALRSRAIGEAPVEPSRQP